MVLVATTQLCLWAEKAAIDNTGSPLSAVDTFQDPQCMPETTDGTIFPTCIPMITFNLEAGQIRD